MYAVIRAGGKQYRVTPGDVIKVEKVAVAQDGTVEFKEVLAFSDDEGQIGGPKGETRVIGTVMEQGRRDKILVFHFKRKKQYKKLNGHRQPFAAVRIAEITYDGQRFSAPELPAPKPKKAPAPKTEEGAEASAEAAAPATKKVAKKATAKKPTAKASKKPAPKNK
jgi:large subunit ribosomal protein L21